MNRPRDVSPRAFKAMMKDMQGLTLKASYRVGGTRYFEFNADTNSLYYRRGNIVEVPVTCRHRINGACR